ncbi:Nucleic acid-binding, OB-fold [Sesbania bispinosa]|nr:Nucleic acid-binding, OB-fold [Sesbania bispinosa]
MLKNSINMSKTDSDRYHSRRSRFREIDQLNSGHPGRRKQEDQRKEWLEEEKDREKHHESTRKSSFNRTKDNDGRSHEEDSDVDWATITRDNEMQQVDGGWSWRDIGRRAHDHRKRLKHQRKFDSINGDTKNVSQESSGEWYKIKVLVLDETDSTELIMFDVECYSLINIPCKRLLSDSKAKQGDSYSDEILEFIGQELLFRVELNEDGTSTYFDESIKVRKICFDPCIINEFWDLIDDETPLKLKFAPAFSKFEQSGGKSCIIDLTPNNAPIASEYEVTPGCSAQSSSTPSKSNINSKPLV